VQSAVATSVSRNCVSLNPGTFFAPPPLDGTCCNCRKRRGGDGITIALVAIACAVQIVEACASRVAYGESSVTCRELVSRRFHYSRDRRLRRRAPIQRYSIPLQRCTTIAVTFVQRGKLHVPLQTSHRPSCRPPSTQRSGNDVGPLRWF
jgi:hypothetical protein